MSCAAAARQYAGQGCNVLPLEPGGKRPAGRLVPHGVHDATTDLATIGRWWRAEPDANLGIGTGEGLAVADVDRRDGGPDTLAAYCQNTGARLPSTPEVATGDGRHLYFTGSPDAASRRGGAGGAARVAGRGRASGRLRATSAGTLGADRARGLPGGRAPRRGRPVRRPPARAAPGRRGVLHLVLAWNRYANRPPLPDAEVGRIVDDLAAKELAKYRAAA